MAHPIWRDSYITLGTSDYVDYRVKIQSTSEVIYQGRAYRKPGESSVKIRINDICADFYKVLATMPQAEFNNYTIPVVFVVEAFSGGSWVSKGTDSFFNDWSYNDSYVEADDGMCFPINGHFDIRMPLPYTVGVYANISAALKYKNGTTGSATISPTISVYYPSSDDSFVRSIRASGAGCALFYPRWNWGDTLAQITLNGMVTYRNVTDCAKYALYYINPYGGWDAFLIEGNDMESDSYTRYKREIEYDNRQPANRGIDNYVNEIVKGVTLHTGWLTKGEGLRMHFLVGSTDVYLYDIPNGLMLPVTIAMSSCDYKTFRNQGNRLVNYTLQVEVAQNRIRR